MKRREMTKIALAGSLLLIPLAIVAAVRAEGSARQDGEQASASVRGVRQNETQMGNIVSDALRSTAKADIAFVNAGVFRSGMRPMTNPTQDAILGALEDPSEELVVVSLKGAQVREALERCVWFAPQPFAGFLQVSGVKFTYKTKADGGSRLQKVTVAGQPLDDNKSYKVALPKALATGQQGYAKIWGRDITQTATKKSIGEAVKEYLATSPSLAGVDGRIVGQD
jgi:5'-nucleotidase / UDP-sugar diphosphatase